MLCFGIAIRLFNYLSNRALWLDELKLSLNIISRDYAGLLEPLDYRQGAPIGFLMLQKLATDVFGPNEYALRIFPLMAGIASLFLIYVVVRDLCGKETAILGLVLFTLSHWLVYFSHEAKPYIFDLLVFLLILKLMYIPLIRKISMKSYLLAGLFGALFIWFSNVSEIILLVVGMVLFISAIRKSSPGFLFGYFAMVTLWLGSFAAYYFLFLFDHPFYQSQVESFISAGYMPDTKSFEVTLDWLINRLKDLSFYFIGGRADTVGLLLCLAGIFLVIICKDYHLILFIIPFIVHLVITLLHKYPFGKRFTVYLALSFYFFIAYGTYYLLGRFRYKALFVLPVRLFLVSEDLKNSHEPYKFQEVRGLWNTLKIIIKMEILFMYMAGLSSLMNSIRMITSLHDVNL